MPLVYSHGPMSAGKSTIALQTHYNYQATGVRGLLLTQQDRAGGGIISSRIGISASAIEIDPSTDVYRLVVDEQKVPRGGFVVIDEAQFLTRPQVMDLAKLVDECDISVDCFGLSSDFRGCLFEGSAALFALADKTFCLPIPVFCWCGKQGVFNARVVNGVVVHEGQQIVKGDVAEVDAGTVAEPSDVVSYQVLCRKHWRLKMRADVVAETVGDEVESGGGEPGLPQFGSLAHKVFVEEVCSGCAESSPGDSS